jgi:hypothetical protein
MGTIEMSQSKMGEKKPQREEIYDGGELNGRGGKEERFGMDDRMDNRDPFDKIKQRGCLRMEEGNSRGVPPPMPRSDWQLAKGEILKCHILFSFLSNWLC